MARSRRLSPRRLGALVVLCALANVAGCATGSDTLSAGVRVARGAVGSVHAAVLSRSTVTRPAIGGQPGTGAVVSRRNDRRSLKLLTPAIGTVYGAPGTPSPLPAGAVALTFDDGPSPLWTAQVLAVLARFHAHATFFDIGIHAARYPNLVRAEFAAGDGVASHTWSHPDLTRLTASAVALQLSETAVTIAGETGRAPICMRPPYDAFNAPVDAVTAHAHETLMLYDVDPRDWARPGVAAIVARVLARVHPGAVVDLHDAGGNRSQTLAALPYILRGLAARHLVTVAICRA